MTDRASELTDERSPPFHDVNEQTQGSEDVIDSKMHKKEAILENGNGGIVDSEVWRRKDGRRGEAQWVETV